MIPTPSYGKNTNMSAFSRLADLWKAFISLFVADVDLPTKVEPIVKEVDGKKISILGAPATGKTRLWDFITKDIKGQGYKVTVSEETLERTFILDGQTIVLAKSHDLGGDTAFVGAWKALYDTSDILLYLVNGELLYSQNAAYIRRVEEDLNEIRNWREKENIRKSFIIVVTWCDKISTLRDNLPKGVTGDKQFLIRIRPLADSVLTMGAHILLGSTDAEKIERTTAMIFQQVRVYK